jgi:hypothetical protein
MRYSVETMRETCVEVEPDRESHSEDRALQAEYFRWQTQGLDITFAFTKRCKHLIDELIRKRANSEDPKERAESAHIPIENDDTFETVWLDNEGRPCCAAMIDDGAPMGWRVEFLDMAHQRELHETLLRLYQESNATALPPQRSGGRQEQIVGNSGGTP